MRAGAVRAGYAGWGFGRAGHVIGMVNGTLGHCGLSYSQGWPIEGWPIVWAGESVSAVKRVQPAAEIMRELADEEAAILFYSTDYDELIGCCDRVLVMCDGAIKRELIGDEITERALIGSALNIGAEARKTILQAGLT